MSLGPRSKLNETFNLNIGSCSSNNDGKHLEEGKTTCVVDIGGAEPMISGSDCLIPSSCSSSAVVHTTGARLDDQHRIFAAEAKRNFSITQQS
ncbi:hypothetical protein PM082_011380 [Marasmius tenuissimus]|nr:hypothetical protein PM082_011380 [Marasmius tenuissimus]